MIAFVSLFLGLIVGSRPVTVAADPSVAAVAVELDGRTVGRLAGAPWTLAVDFGREFEPHELVARAYDADGGEVGLARQWINLPRSPAEVEIVLERNGFGNAVAARLTWESVLGDEPERLTVTFDGKALPVERKRVVLPPHDPQLTHVLSAVLDYPLGLRSRSDVVLGGGSAGQAQSELTAVPVVSPKRRTLRVEELQGRFRVADRALSVAAVEHGPAEILLVRDLSSVEAQRALRLGEHAPRSAGGAAPPDTTDLEADDRVRILWPVVRKIAVGLTTNELFEPSREFTGKVSMRFLLERIDYPGPTGSPRRFADAIAVAGLDAFGSYARRAVVLALGASTADASRYDAAAVRRYLARLRVPLHVWSLAGPGSRPSSETWGALEDISSTSRLESAVDRLRKDLERQSIVWVEGRHLPQDIVLTDAGDGLTLAR